VQINFPGYLCTLGFNARDGNQDSFITNSHCTTKQGGVESTPYYQPLQSSHPTVIGVEVEDPQYSKSLPGCPRSKLCRYSDAARVRYNSGINFDLGKIATPTGPASLTYNGSWSIYDKGPVTQGQTVSKVGRTTGLSTGTVTNTDVLTGVQGTRFAQIGQFFVSAAVGSGDSGSPVIRESGGNVYLVGILWGGSGSTTFVGSPIANIEAELGTLTVK